MLRTFRSRRASGEVLRRCATLGDDPRTRTRSPRDDQRRSDKQSPDARDKKDAPIELQLASDRLPQLQLPVVGRDVGIRPETGCKPDAASPAQDRSRQALENDRDRVCFSPRPPSTKRSQLTAVPRSNATILGEAKTYIVPMPTQVPRRATDFWPDQITDLTYAKFSSEPPRPPLRHSDTGTASLSGPFCVTQTPMSHGQPARAGLRVETSLCDLITLATASRGLRADLLETMEALIEQVRIEAEVGRLDAHRLFTPQLGPALLEEMQRRCDNSPKKVALADSESTPRKGRDGFDDNLSGSRLVRLWGSGRVYDGMSMEGPDIVHMDRGNFFFKKGVKQYWRLVAVDSTEVTNFEELRAAVDLRRKMNGRNFKVTLEADEESARQHHEWQRKVLIKTLKSLKKSDELDLFFLERERGVVLRNKEAIGNLITQHRVMELEVLLGNATAAEMESFLELIACLKADLTEEVRRIVSQSCVRLALRDDMASTAVHHARSKGCLDMVLKIAPPGVAHKRNSLGQTAAQSVVSNSPHLADAFIDSDICSLLAIDFHDGRCGAMHLEGTCRESFESRLPSWKEWSAALQAFPEVMLEALEVPGSRVAELSKETGDKTEIRHRGIIEPIHYFCFNEPALWEHGQHTAISSSRLREVTGAALRLFAGLVEEPRFAEPLKILLQATKGPRHDKLDPRAPWRDDLEMTVGLFEKKVREVLDAEYEKVRSSESCAWILALEDSLLVPGLRLRSDSQLDGCPSLKHPEWVWEHDFDAALHELNYLGVFNSPTAVHAFTRRVGSIGDGLQALERQELTFMRLHAIQRREICQVHVNNIRDWFASWAAHHDCTFSARKTAKQVERVLVKASLTADEVVASCSSVPKRDLQTAADYVTDINGVELVMASMASLEKIYAAITNLRWKRDGAQLMRVKNLFHPSADVSETGYRDLKVWVLVDIEGLPLIVEVQLHLRAFHKFKKGMHVAYEYRRGSFDHDHVQPPCPTRSRRLIELREAMCKLESTEITTLSMDDVAQKIRAVIRAISKDGLATDEQVRQEVGKATALLGMLDAKIGAQQELDHVMSRCVDSSNSAAVIHRMLTTALENAGRCGLDCEAATLRLDELEKAWCNDTREGLASERPAALKIALNDAEQLGLHEMLVREARERYEKFASLVSSLNMKLVNSFDNPEDIRKVLWDSADPNFTNERGGCALLLAVKAKKASAVQVLLEARADPNRCSKRSPGNAPLHAASRLANDSNASSIIELLLNANAEVNLENEEGWRPLHFAALQKAESETFDDCFNLLKRSKASINKRLPDARHERLGGSSVLHLAVEAGNRQAVSLLLKNKAKVNASQPSGCTPLWLAVSHGNAYLTQELLASDADVTIVDSSSNSLLHQVAFSGQAALIDMLVDAKARINACNDKGQTPLAIARSHGVQEKARMLLDAFDRLGAHL